MFQDPHISKIYEKGTGIEIHIYMITIIMMNTGTLSSMSVQND